MSKDEPIQISLQVADVLRASEVDRWQLVAVTRRQSLAEHTFNVMALAVELYRRAVSTPPSEYAYSCIMRAAFIHDLPEVLCGDIPTPTKDVTGVRKALDPIEEAMDFNGLRLHHDALPPEEKQLISSVVKAADILDACVYLHYYSVKTPHSIVVKEKLLGRLKECDWNAYDLYTDILNHDASELGEIYGSWDV